MKLYVAEKPSLGRAIADALPKPLSRSDGYITAANGDTVSWCIGHLLEQAEPHTYNPQYKSWRIEHLPIVPDQWQLTPKADTKKQLGLLRKLVKEAKSLVHAGDPDREGQLLVDQLFNYLKVGVRKRSAIQRLLISDMNPSAVQRALQRLENNSNYAPLSASALARSRADWLYGINMTRAYTIQGRRVGYDGVLSVGRVQTPVLGLVVRRCEEIENFISKPFYEVEAHLKTLTDKPESFTATWQPSEACQPWMDDENRVLSHELAENVCGRITDKPAVVDKHETKNKKQPPPLPYSLSVLQIDAAKRYGMSAQLVLAACQSLYEKHRLITYPRSDCRYLPREHWHDGSTVLAAVADNVKTMATAVAIADISLKSTAWNDSKVTAHHAIIPTSRRMSVQSLSSDEQNIYSLVAHQYLAQFYPVHEYADTRVRITIEGGVFNASAKVVLKDGWKVLFARDKDSKKAAKTLPVLKQGQALYCDRGELLERNTTPPPYFTDATLLAAMTGIARFVSSADIRKILKDTDGLGTEATRAGIIELLFRRGFMIRKGKQIHATDAGRGLIKSLPDIATRPDMTANWESVLNAISQRESSYGDFMRPLLEQLHTLISSSAATMPEALRGVPAAKPQFVGKKAGKKRRGKKMAQSMAGKSGRKVRPKKG